MPHRPLAQNLLLSLPPPFNCKLQAHIHRTILSLRLTPLCGKVTRYNSCLVKITLNDLYPSQRPPFSMRSCYCDQCTADGNNAQDALQCRSALQQHKKMQQATDRIRQTSSAMSLLEASQSFEQAAILGTLRNRVVTDESPLFRASIARHDPPDVPDVVTVDSTRSPSPFHLPSAAELQMRISRYKLPPTLRFLFPPTSPMSMYPGSGGHTAWDNGPSALRLEDSANAKTLLHVAYFEPRHATAMHFSRCPLPSTSLLSTPRTPDSELQRMVQFGKGEWERQRSRQRPGFPDTHVGRDVLPVHYDSGTSHPSGILLPTI